MEIEKDMIIVISIIIHGENREKEQASSTACLRDSYRRRWETMGDGGRLRFVLRCLLRSLICSSAETLRSEAQIQSLHASDPVSLDIMPFAFNSIKHETYLDAMIRSRAP
jgi:hypothetical protein